MNPEDAPPKPVLTERKSGTPPALAAAIGAFLGLLVGGFLLDGMGMFVGIVLGGGIALMIARRG
ncbi:MAG TPA: hypothetical protein VM490_26430 [Armatimonadaceae bacterium]|jgi:hypothetical protein|nr:hypothetical protein [Armatimonadaceae bacterium]